MGPLNKSELAQVIDYTLLGPESSWDKVNRICEETKEYGFGAVCVDPVFVAYARELLEDTEAKVCSVVGFPHGTKKGGVKGFEAELALEDGAEELDMVANIPALIAGRYRLVAEDIKSVTKVSRSCAKEVAVKVILETGLLEKAEKRAGAVIAKAAGADFVKTSTGFGHGGATVEDVEILRRTVGPDMGVKAAGGIGSYQRAVRMIEAGADRIGTSSGVEILEGASG